MLDTLRLLGLFTIAFWGITMLLIPAFAAWGFWVRLLMRPTLHESGKSPVKETN